MKVYAILFLLICGQFTRAQNLISNGGFEDENICTEYTKNCAPEAWIATSLMATYYFDDSIHAYKGRHFAGLSAGNVQRAGIRNFLRTRLLCAMQKGKTYRLNFYVRARNRVLDSIGVYFSENDFLFERRNFKQIEPQLWHHEDSRADPAIWKLLSFEYTSTGKEGYLTIGAFKREDHKGVHRAEYRNDYYFFLDDVSLVPIDPNERICANADSVRDAQYAENERHELLSRKLYTLMRKPPPPVPLSPTVAYTKQKVDTLIIPDVFFATASYELSTQSHQVLDSLSERLNSLPVDSIVVEGHTDSVGKMEYNTTLSSNRALAVKNYLINRTSSKELIFSTRGYAYLRPIAENKTSVGRSRNRRVEIFVYRKEE